MQRKQLVLVIRFHQHTHLQDVNRPPLILLVHGALGFKTTAGQ
jgi:hypothetical protein